MLKATLLLLKILFAPLSAVPVGLLGILLLLSSNAAWPDAAVEQEAPAGNGRDRTIRMFCLGSSSLYYHNMPKLVGGMLAGQTKRSVVVDLAGRSGTGVHVYLREGFKAEYGLQPGETVLGRIEHGEYRYLVLQVPAEFIAGPEGDEHDRSLDVYCAAIRRTGGEPVFYEMGWGRDEKAELGRRKIFNAAVRNKVVLFVPCSTAWARVRRERPDLELQNLPDTSHPGTLGLHLNLACFRAVLVGGETATEEPASSATYKIWRKPADSERSKWTEIAKRTTFDAYDEGLPGWIRMHLVHAKQEAVSPELVAYFWKVAREETQRMRARLREALDRTAS